jgi:hypothetical protein
MKSSSSFLAEMSAVLLWRDSHIFLKIFSYTLSNVLNEYQDEQSC